MQLTFSSYIAGNTPLHRMDARVKLALLIAYILALFFADTWLGLGLFALMGLLVFAASRLSAGSMLRLLSPAFFLAALLIVFNAFVFAPAAGASGLEGAHDLRQLAGPVCVSFSGLESGLFSAVRVVLLVLSSLVVGLTTTSTELSSVAAWALAPLRRLHAPVDDIATVFSIALRFIPLMAEEFCRIRNAQWSRACGFDDESLIGRIKAWGKVLMPMIMSLFRRADALSEAMDARCYGAAEERGALTELKLDAASAACLAAGLVSCALVAYLL